MFCQSKTQRYSVKYDLTGLEIFIFERLNMSSPLSPLLYLSLSYHKGIKKPKNIFKKRDMIYKNICPVRISIIIYSIDHSIDQNTCLFFFCVTTHPKVWSHSLKVLYVTFRNVLILMTNRPLHRNQFTGCFRQVLLYLFDHWQHNAINTCKKVTYSTFKYVFRIRDSWN